MRSLISSRQGHIPTILLFVEGLVLMTLVWFVFLTQKQDLNSLSYPIIEGISSVSSLDSYVRNLLEVIVDQSITDVKKQGQGNFESEFRKSFEKRVAAVDSLGAKNTNFFGLIRTQSYILNKDDSGVYTLKLTDVFVKSEAGKNSFNRDFNMTIRFNSSSLVSG